MKKLILFVVVVAIIAGGYYWYRVRNARPEPTVLTQSLSRGDVVDTVGATGTLEAVETVEIGTQVSGVVQELHADFNSIVKKGQIIARLDPQLIQTQIEQQTANVQRAEADLARLEVALADAQQKLERAKQMSAKQLIPQTELETAEVNVRSADAQIRSSKASLTQAQAQLNNQRVNLGYTTIVAPIDGIIISRNVDQGQTVQASMNAPVLYLMAADLTKMQVLANIDEADVGRMRPRQRVTFRVDAYPTETFIGEVAQVRLQPTTVQNVVTYSTVISVPNPELKLKPGMTANVAIEIARKNNVLRIPNAATRFRPTTEMFQVLNQAVPPELERGRGGRGGRGEGQRAGGGPGGGQDQPAPAAAPGGNPPAAATGAPAAAQAATPGQQRPQATVAAGQDRGPRGGSGGTNGGRPAQDGGAQAPTDGGGRQAGEGSGGRGGGRGGGFDPNLSPEERRKRFEERMAQASPEERERMQARMREGGGNRDGGGRQGAGGANAQAGNRQGGGRSNPPAGLAATAQGATTIDSLFGPLPTTESRGTAWQYENKQLKAIRLRLGVSDGTFTEVLNESEVPANAEVVTSMTTGLEQRNLNNQNQQNNPLMGPQRGQPGRGGPGGGGGGGGGGRGRG
jgi:HlyD family secretion protein